MYFTSKLLFSGRERKDFDQFAQGFDEFGLAWIFQWILYKILIMNDVTKKPAEPRKEAPKDKENKAQKRDASKQDGSKQDEPKGLTKEDLPDATNESTGAMGSGQRQDSN